MKNIFILLKLFGIVILVSCLFLETNFLNAQWINTGPSGRSIGSLVFSGSNLFAAANNGVYVSSNNGSNWVYTSNGLPNTNVYVMALSGSYLFAGTYGGGIYRSTNNGANWIPVNNGLTNFHIFSFAVSGTNIFAGTSIIGGGGGVFLSTNFGIDWTSVSSGLPFAEINALAISGSNIFAGTYGSGVFLSQNNGVNWTPAGMANAYVYSLAISGSNTFAGTDNSGVFLTTNNGVNWNYVSNGLPIHPSCYALAFSGTNIFVGISIGGGVYRSADNGANWTSINSGSLTGFNIISFALDNANLYAGTGGSGVWKRPLSEIISVKLISSEIPEYFRLGQNYPNPFNPETTISFSIPSRSFVTIKIFDALGNQVTTLLSEQLQAGTYSQRWNAEHLPSGVYFYRIVAGSFSETKNLVFLK